MPSTTRRKPPRDTLNLRIRPGQRDLIDRAAALAGRTRTDFVLEAAQRAAVDMLTERTLFLLEPGTFERFKAALDAPPNPSPRLERTMQTPARWERK